VEEGDGDLTLMLHKSYQTGMLPNLSNAALSGILWVTGLFTKRDLCNMLGIPVFNVGRWPLESFGGFLPNGQSTSRRCRFIFLTLPAQHPCLLDYIVFLQHQG